MPQATIVGDGCRIALSVFGYEYGSAADYHDANWLNGAVGVELGGYRALQPVSWQAGELAEFAAAIERVSADGGGTAELRHVEHQVSLKLQFAGEQGRLEGRVRCHGLAELSFEGVALDRAGLDAAAADVRAVSDAFPVRPAGDPQP